MKTLIKLSFLIGAMLLSASVSFAGTQCTTSSTYTGHTGLNAADSTNGRCLVTPSALVLKFHEFGLCTTSASPLAKTSCTKLLDSFSGVELDISAGGSIPLANGVTLDEGTYTHAYVILNKNRKINGSFEFATSRTANNGTTGKFCYTNGSNADLNTNYAVGSTSTISCASTSSPTPVPGTMRLVDNSQNHANTQLNVTLNLGSETVVDDLYMIQSDGSLATTFSNNFAIFVSQSLINNITISPNTSALDIKFIVTDGATINFNQNGGPCGDANGCPTEMDIRGLLFKVVAN
jgi:hypothetical protein